MTHFQPTIKALRDFNPRTAKVKKAKKVVLSALYSEERKEGKPRKQRKQSQPRKRKGSFIGFIGKSASKAVSNYRTRQQEKRIEKAHKVKAIRESNLPQEKKEVEQAKLKVPVYKEPQPTIQKEKPKPFGGFKSAETEHTSEGV